MNCFGFYYWLLTTLLRHRASCWLDKKDPAQVLKYIGLWLRWSNIFKFYTTFQKTWAPECAMYAGHCKTFCYLRERGFLSDLNNQPPREWITRLRESRCENFSEEVCPGTPLGIGSLSKRDVDESENVIWKCDFAFLQSFFNYANSLCLKNVL